MRRCIFIVIITSLFIISGCTKQSRDNHQTQQVQSNAEPTESTELWGRTIQYNGDTYRYNSRLRTFLFLGIDNRSQVQETTIVGSGGRSDTMMLFVIDPDQQMLQVMPISRDTITSVEVYDHDRNFLFTGSMQITMQYSFGDSPARSCQLSKRAVSNLLHGIPINYFCSLNLDGITVAVNHFGGITLTFEEDWTDIDPSYTIGSTATMDAEQVEAFLRYRDTTVDASNNTRMNRQVWFISQMFSQVASMGYDTMIDLLGPYMETDLDGDTVHQLTSFSFSHNVIEIPGENINGESHDEFYVDDEALQELVLRTFYNKKVE